jgi:hypothetical protein
LDRTELGHHLRRFAIRQEATEARRALHQFRRRLIRADIARDRPGGAKMRQTTLAVHDPRVSKLNAAEHRSDLALAAILDLSEALAIRTEPARENVSLALLLDDDPLEMSHDGFAILDREADFAS